MMTKRLIALSVIAVSAVFGLAGCATTTQTPVTATQPQTKTAHITSTGHAVNLNVRTGTRDNGIAQVTMLGSNSEYQYAVPVSDGSIHATLTIPWDGKTNIGVIEGSKMVANSGVTVSGQALSEQQLDLLPSYLMDSNIQTVAQQAHTIASSVTTQGMKRNQALASASMQWVRQHIRTANQGQTARADQTLQSRSANQASRTALAVALLRANNIPAKAVQKQENQDGLYGTSYSVSAWISGKWTNIGTP
ncbi:transglutaminase domain-containing protein [Alicyclobacillus ferrooxydans]|uniref:Transglutaminase-like domain-containing protein n=1 Tax=Alicyclobacillus ferrooxydans TaxID=471514 RepID=A0A0P9D0E3_9BACL|nr:transglutaminase domain-containing protein [Alicyclobacillus ferrooxydans]KPV45491.1 hypothetical protein AN477_00575 [Alicyclobacillus ferrooxydans]